MKKSLEIHIRPDWQEIETAREDSTRFLEGFDLSDDHIHALTMIISELIENSIKYGIFKSSENGITVGIYVSRNLITLEVSNPVDQTAKEHLRKLDKAIQWIRGYQDPFQAYTERLKEVSKRPLHDAESGLGLARIAYEGQAILDFIVSEDNTLSVSAVADL